MLRIVSRDLHAARLARVPDNVIISTLLLNENRVDELVAVSVISVLLVVQYGQPRSDYGPLCAPILTCTTTPGANAIPFAKEQEHKCEAHTSAYTKTDERDAFSI